MIHAHDKAYNWEKCVSFIPNAGEIIVYDADEKYSYERFKIGDGKTKLIDLPFSIEKVITNMFDIRENNVYIDGGRI